MPEWISNSVPFISALLGGAVVWGTMRNQIANLTKTVDSNCAEIDELKTTLNTQHTEVISRLVKLETLIINGKKSS